jgi:hypothetical protein
VSVSPLPPSRAALSELGCLVYLGGLRKDSDLRGFWERHDFNACRIAMRETDEHKVSLDQVIATMYQTGMDMQSRYKETSLAGVAVNVIEC